jgi:hypothetical protein
MFHLYIHVLYVGMKTILSAAVMALALLVSFLVPAYASHSVSPNACYNDGEEAGQNGPFSQELYEFCEEYGDEYYDGFIDGCMSVEGNTREVCEQAADAD